MTDSVIIYKFISFSFYEFTWERESKIMLTFGYYLRGALCVLMFFLDNFKSDCVLRTMFLSKRDAVKSVCQAFENYVTV